VYGPYFDKHRQRWRVVVIAPDGKRTVETFASKKRATAVLADAREEAALGTLTVAEALDEYLDHQRVRGLKPGTITTTGHRLRDLIEGTDDLAIVDLSPRRAQRLYDSLAARRAVDTHRNTLGQAKTWGKWLAKRGYVSASPFAEIEGIGRRKRGKPQLTGTEARQLLDHCLARPQDPGAVGVVACLVLGLRAGEVCALELRDVDGDVLHVRGTKTDAAARRVQLPPFVADLLTDALPLGLSRYGLLGRCKTLCRAAGVPEVPPHGLRGTHASIATSGGASGVAVAATLGHASEAVTRRHYTSAEAATEGQQRRALEVLQGGRR
jgi:integrase